MSKSIYGYVRVSTKEQNLDRQLIAMREYGVPEKNIFIDKQSGKDFDRPAYQRMMKELSSGGVLVIKSIDRLGRSYDETIEEWRRITREKGIEIVVLDLPVMCSLPTGTLLGRLLADLILYLLSYFAQAEREMNHQRQAEGIAAARLRGVRFGRREKERTEEFYALREEWQKHQVSARQAAEKLAIDHKTFLRWAREER